jgi:hypothetical protein
MTERNGTKSRDLIYGRAWFHDCLAFADALTAAAAADEITSIASAATWRAAAAVVCRHIWNPVADTVDEDPEGDWDRPFDIFDVAAVADGDWPPMVTARALELLPGDVLAEFASVVSTSLNGDYADIPVTEEPKIVHALEARGYRVNRDENLINVLDGRTFNGVGDGEAVWPVEAVAGAR